MKKIIKSDKMILTISLIIIFITSLVLFQEKLIGGDDLEFHISRIMSMKDKISIGKPLSYIYPYVLNNYGYGLGFFYCDIFLLIPAILCIVINDIVLSYKIFIVIINILCMLTMYICIINMTKNKKAALLCSIIYELCPYRLTTLYIRASLGESIAFIFLPFIVYGLYEIIYNDYKKNYFLIIGMSGLILSHNMTLVTISPFILMFILFNIKRILKNKKIVFSLLISIIFIFMISGFYVLPMLEQSYHSKFLFYYAGSDCNVSNRALNFFTIFTEFNLLIKSKYFNPPGIGLILTFSLVYFLFNIKKSSKITKQLYLIGFVMLLMTTNIFPWNALNPYLKFIQFPWRLLSPICTILVIGFGTILKKINHKVILSILILMMPVGLIINLKSLKNYTYNDFLYSVAWGEYLPIEASLDKINERNDVIKSRYNIDISIEYYTTPLDYIKIKFDHNKKSNEIEFPVIYYEGYKATVNGIERETYKTEDGLVGIVLKEENGIAVINYEKTLIQKIGQILSILGALGFILYKVKQK